jgi:hypothetical protein
LQKQRRRLEVSTEASSVTSAIEAANELVKDTSFEVGLAIALAGCAFEAYNDPTGVAPDLREIAVNGTAVTYVNQCEALKLLPQFLHDSHIDNKYFTAASLQFQFSPSIRLSIIFSLT